jgi:hypothetical protein
VDTRPGVPAGERYKALAGVDRKSGLVAFASADGIHWKRMGDAPAFNDLTEEHVFDSQNVAFWSHAEQCYVLYYRVFKDKIRSVARATSTDFQTWTRSGLMTFTNDAPTQVEQLYTNQTVPYFRADHIYISFAARFMAERKIWAEDSQTNPASKESEWLSSDCSDLVLMTSRGGGAFDRTFPQAFLRPGADRENWGSRGNYAALGLAQTGAREMSMYVQRHYGLPTNYLERLTLRLDGFASVRADRAVGELVTKPLLLSGATVKLNFETSAAGSIKVQIEKLDGSVLPEYSFAAAHELIGDEMDAPVRWRQGPSVSNLRGTPVRLRIQLKEADLYSLRCAGDE